MNSKYGRTYKLHLPAESHDSNLDDWPFNIGEPQQHCVLCGYMCCIEPGLSVDSIEGYAHTRCLKLWQRANVTGR